MATVTGMVNYLKDVQRYNLMSIRKVEVLEDDELLEPQSLENIAAVILGQAIPNLALVELGQDPELVYRPTFLGIKIFGIFNDDVEDLNFPDCVMKETRDYNKALKLSSYESYYRVGSKSEVKPANKETIKNIEIMIERIKSFLKEQKEIINVAGELDGAYTNKIHKGEYDILTKNALIDIKIRKTNATSRDLLQIIIYYLMGRKSMDKKHFNDIERLMIYNPRLNRIYYIDVEDLSDELISLIEKEIIGYE